MKCVRESILFNRSSLYVTLWESGTKNIGRAGRVGWVYLASRTTPTIRYVRAYSGRSMPKCLSSGSSDGKKRRTNASFTTAIFSVLLGVRLGDSSAAKHWLSDRLEVAGAHAVPGRVRVLADVAF